MSGSNDLKGNLLYRWRERHQLADIKESAKKLKKIFTPCRRERDNTGERRAQLWARVQWFTLRVRRPWKAPVELKVWSLLHCAHSPLSSSTVKSAACCQVSIMKNKCNAIEVNRNWKHLVRLFPAPRGSMDQQHQQHLRVFCFPFCVCVCVRLFKKLRYNSYNIKYPLLKCSKYTKYNDIQQSHSFATITSS